MWGGGMVVRVCVCVDGVNVCVLMGLAVVAWGMVSWVYLRGVTGRSVGLERSAVGRPAAAPRHHRPQRSPRRFFVFFFFFCGAARRRLSALPVQGGAARRAARPCGALSGAHA